MLENLKPERLWYYFEKLCDIPHCSKNEEKLILYLTEIADKLALSWKKDSIGNIVVYKPASAGCEDVPTTVLQAHVDMVCEKNDNVLHDFCKDSLKLKIIDNFVCADGTSLGADNGIGVAAMLALAEDENVKHGPLELLFTVDEETGLTGAMELDPSLLSGRTMLNLDTEEDSALYIGCAGGLDSVITKKIVRSNSSGDCSFFHITVKGLKGGHSGIDINSNRASANVLLTRVLFNIMEKHSLQIVTLSGGSKRNAIARESSAVIALPSGKDDVLFDLVKVFNETFNIEYKGCEDSIEVNCAKVESGAYPPISVADSRAIINLMTNILHGPLKMSIAVDGLVETSSNFAIISTNADTVRIDTSQRSSIESQLDWAGNVISAIASMAGAEIKQGGRYPGWQPDRDSLILKKCSKVYEELYGVVPEVKAVHAGLECGLIGMKIPGMDMVSLGPDIFHPHSPDERVSIVSVEKFWQYLTAILEDIAG